MLTQLVNYILAISDAKVYQYLSIYNDNLVITFLCALVVEQLNSWILGEVLFDTVNYLVNQDVILLKIFLIFSGYGNHSI